MLLLASWSDFVSQPQIWKEGPSSDEAGKLTISFLRSLAMGSLHSLCTLMLSQRLFIGSAWLLCPTAEHTAYQSGLMDFLGRRWRA